MWSGWPEFSARWISLHAGPYANPPWLPLRLLLRAGYLGSRLAGRLRMSPGAVTVMGVLFAFGAPAAAVFGGDWLFLAALAVLASAAADYADGALAASTSRVGRVGAFSDSVADRISETAWLVALWLAGVPGVLVAATGVLVWLHEYARARSASVGLRGSTTITLADRSSRVFIVAVAFLIGGLVSRLSDRLAAGAITMVVAVWLVLGIFGAWRLFEVIRASEPRPVEPGPAGAAYID